MNDQRRQAAIEAGADEIAGYQIGSGYYALTIAGAEAREIAAAVIDAAAPHLLPSPIGYGVATPLGRAVAVCATLDGAQHLRELMSVDAEDGLRVVALVPVEDQP